MTSRQEPTLDLFQLLERWREVTNAEHNSILAENWLALEQLQTRKTGLQEQIDLAHSRALSRLGESPAPSLLNQRLRHVADELLKLESKNRQLLADKMAANNCELKELNKSSQSIRHVHRAYGSSDRSFWQAYS